MPHIKTSYIYFLISVILFEFNALKENKSHHTPLFELSRLNKAHSFSQQQFVLSNAGLDCRGDCVAVGGFLERFSDWILCSASVDMYLSASSATPLGHNDMYEWPRPGVLNG